MACTNLALGASSLGNSLAGACPTEYFFSIPSRSAQAATRLHQRGDSHAAVEVHAVDTNRRIILDAQINVLGNSKPKVAGFGKVLLSQFVFFHLQTALKNFLL